jgi:hypothetical protein
LLLIICFIPCGFTSKQLFYDGNVPIVNAKDEPIILINNNNAVNPSYAELLVFLATDNTDEIPYDTNSFICANFANRLHNNAEMKGIRCSFVLVWINFYDYRDIDKPVMVHAINAFETTDKGLVYIDDTGEGDKVVDVKIYKDYIAELLFQHDDNITLGNMGMVTDITIWW